jgi:hypothetical protein
MDSKSDCLVLNYKDNPDLKAALADMQPGDSVTLELTCTVRSNDDEAFDGMIDEIEVDSAAEDAEDKKQSETDEKKKSDKYSEGSSSMDSAEPALIIVTARNKMKK